MLELIKVMAVKTHKRAAATQPKGTPGKDLLMASLDMSWRLAIVVLVPIVGGFYIDKALEMLPVFTIVGFFVAMAGTAYVMWRTLKEYNS